MTQKPRDPRVEITPQLYRALCSEATLQYTTPKDLIAKWITANLSPKTRMYLGIDDTTGSKTQKLPETPKVREASQVASVVYGMPLDGQSPAKEQQQKTPTTPTTAKDLVEAAMQSNYSATKTPKAPSSRALAKEKEDEEDKRQIKIWWDKGLRKPAEIRDALGGRIKGSRISKLLAEMGLRDIRKWSPKNT